MKTLIPCIFFLAVLVPAQAQEQRLRTIEPEAFIAGEILDGGVVRIAADAGTPRPVLLDLATPDLSQPIYAIKGDVRYDNVEGTAYLQMDSHFDDGAVYFSKTLAANGPLQSLSGTSPWRPFTLPFYAIGPGDTRATAPKLPTKITLSVHLPGSGTVALRGLALFEYAGTADPLAGAASVPGPGAALGLIGSIGGALVGLWGALAGTLAARGKARGFTLGSAGALIGAGALCLVAGLYATMTGPRPWGGVLAVAGLVLVIVIAAARAALLRQYRALELKKMRAMDA